MNKQEAFDKTVSMLEEHQNKRRQIAGLRYELEHANYVTEEEMIGQMALPGEHGEGGRPIGHISDKTMYIALNYEDRARRINDDEVQRILDLLTPLEEEAERLEFYVHLLPPRLRQALELHYFKGLTWAEVAKAETVSARTIADRRRAAVEQLAGLIFLKECAGHQKIPTSN